MDGVFEGIKSWADIDQLDPRPEGTRIRIKPSELDKPVGNVAFLSFSLALYYVLLAFAGNVGCNSTTSIRVIWGSFQN